MPFSTHSTARGQSVRRYLGYNYLKDYKWLAVSKQSGFEGAWCVYCSLFQSSDCGGDRSACVGIGGNEKMGALVNIRLRNFKSSNE